MRNTTLIIVCITAAVFSAGQTLTTLVSFDGNNGTGPNGPLVQGSDGNLYGTAADGGSFLDAGTVFKMTAQGALTTLYLFDYTSGSNPYAPLVEAKDGNFYGTTDGGGAGSVGTVFRISPEGTLTVLYAFNGADGRFPQAPLLQASDGNFYGTTSQGGPANYGTVFRMMPDGTLTTLHSFMRGEGISPVAGLIQASDGNFYGTTYFDDSSSGAGSIFRITPVGTLTTLYRFKGADGEYPRTALVQAKDGNFYGTTSAGGTHGNGTIFRITPEGSLTSLYSFCPESGCIDGADPFGALVQATDGNFFGTTEAGGTDNNGTVFRVTPDGALTTLHRFGGIDGKYPVGALLQTTDGSFYGTTGGGGLSDLGTVFRIVAFATLTVAKPANGTVTSIDGHIYCGMTCSYTYDDGTQVTLSAVPAPGYTFTGWTGCDNVNGSYCSVTMSEAKNVTATFDSASNIILTSLTFKPSYVKGGQLSAGTLTLSGPAPQGGLAVALSSDHPGAAHPPSFVIVPGGKSWVQFAVQTFPVKSITPVAITATAGTSHVSGTLTVGTTSLAPSFK